jgi:hypothetical protein
LPQLRRSGYVTSRIGRSGTIHLMRTSTLLCALLIAAGLAGCGGDDTFSCDVYWGSGTKIAPDTTTDENAADGANAVKQCEADMSLQAEADRATGSMMVTCTCTGS